MAEFTRNAIQEVNPGAPVLLDTSIGCNKGYVYHRPDSGIVTLRGITNNPCARFARYEVLFKGNIAVPTGGTVGPIAVAIAVDGEPEVVSTSMSTPAEVEQYNVAVSPLTIDVPIGCCTHISVENVSAPATAGGVAPAINVQNALLRVRRTA